MAGRRSENGRARHVLDAHSVAPPYLRTIDLIHRVMMAPRWCAPKPLFATLSQLSQVLQLESEDRGNLAFAPPPIYIEKETSRTPLLIFFPFISFYHNRYQ